METSSAVEIGNVDSALSRLTPRQSAFVWYYVTGPDEIRGIAYKAYCAAGYQPTTKDSAYAASSMLLRHPNIRAAIEEARSHIEAEAKVRMQPWLVAAVHAQKLLVDHMQGRIVLTESRQKTIFHVLDRALGKPAQPIEQEVGERLEGLIRELSGVDSAEGPETLEAGAETVDNLLEEVGRHGTALIQRPPVGPWDTRESGGGDGAPPQTNEEGTEPNSLSDGGPLGADFPELKIVKPETKDPDQK
jgi:phage terminase small subunit